MDRLTSELFYGAEKIIDVDYKMIAKWHNKLHEYEGTGLTPEEAAELKTKYDEMDRNFHKAIVELNAAVADMPKYAINPCMVCSFYSHKRNVCNHIDIDDCADYTGYYGFRWRGAEVSEND